VVPEVQGADYGGTVGTDEGVTFDPVKINGLVRRGDSRKDRGHMRVRREIVLHDVFAIHAT
jgi:hypothetical protein